MQELNDWIKRSRTTLARLLPNDAGGGQALFALHRLLNPPEEGGGPFPPLSLEREASLFVGWRVRRSDQTRSMIVYEAERLMAQNGRKATARELALVSILCGQFPEGLKLGGKGRTAAEALEAEQRIMREAQRRLRIALHKRQNPAQ